MANWQVISLDTTTPQLRAPGTGDGYSFNSGSTQLGVWTTTGLGIGTSSPAYKLDVNTGQIRANESSTGTGNGGLIAGTASASGNAGVLFETNATSRWNLTTLGANGASLRFYNYALAATVATLDSSGNLGLGVTPSAWGTSEYKAIQIGNGASVYGRVQSGDQDKAGLSSNAYNDGTIWLYIATDSAANYTQIGGGHYWYTAASGTAGNAITFTQAMTLDASGNLGVGTTSPVAKLQLSTAGSVGASAATNQLFGDYSTAAQLRVMFNNVSNWVGLGTDASNNLIFGTSTANAGTSPTALVTLTQSGNLGIGTASPTEKLHLSSGASADTSILLTSNSTNSYIIQRTSGVLEIYNAANAAMTFRTNSTERARITAAGELVVGTTAAAGSSQVTAYGATNGQIAVQNSTNWSRLLQNSGDLYIDNGVGGSAGNIIFRNSSSTVERARISSTGNVVVNTAAVATTATDGFLYIPTCAGAPTGVPTTFTGRSPLVVDSTNNRFYVYVNGAWKYATLT